MVLVGISEIKRYDLAEPYEIPLVNGLIESRNISSLNSFKREPVSLTWLGHEFLDSTRNDNLWAKAQETMKEIGSFSFQFLFEILLTSPKNQL